MKKTSVCLLICFALLIASCSPSTPEKTDAEEQASHAFSAEDSMNQSATSIPQEVNTSGFNEASDTSATTSLDEVSWDTSLSDEPSSDMSSLEGEVMINMFYSLSRLEFQSFLKDIDGSTFPWEAAIYSLDDKTLERPILLRWEHFCKEFTCTKAGFAALLSEKGVRQELEEFTLFMTYEGVPMAWMQTEDESFFLWGTFASGDLTFVFSEEANFVSFFAEKECRVLVDGSEIDSTIPAVMHGSFAEVPLLAILREFGATVTWESSEKAFVCFNGETYCLDMEAATFGLEEDLLGDCLVTGEYSVIYLAEGDVMVSHTALLTLLDEMGIRCSVSMQNKDALVEYSLR